MGLCQVTCPDSTYLNNQTCFDCPNPCLTCINQGICQSCLGGYLLYLNTSCVSGPKCPNDMYNLNNSKCVKLI